MSSVAESQAPAPRYWAFISYSHGDRKAADWLHDALERYRIPRSVRHVAARRDVPPRIAPVFLDRAELAASDDLDLQIRHALAESATLVVLCSPAAARSTRVEQEICAFRAIHGATARVFAAIVSGRPGARRRGFVDAEECFPPSLHSSDGSSPLAADLRLGRGGRKEALLKLVAAILDINLDVLRQRDQQRARRRLGWLAAAAIGGMTLVSFLGLYAWQQRDLAFAAGEQSRRDARTARATAAFLVDLFKEFDPAQTRGQTLPPVAVLDRGLARVRTALAQEPEVQVAALRAIGDIYKNLGHYPQSESVLRDALHVVASNSPDLDGELPATQAALASAIANLDKHEEAQELLRTAIIVLERDPERELELVSAQALLGYSFWHSGKIIAARDLLSSIRDRAARIGGAESEVVADVLEDLGRATRDSGDPQRGLEYMQESARIRRALFGADYYWYGNALNNIGFTQWHIARYEEAFENFEAARAIFEKVLGTHHPWVAISLYGSGGVLVEMNATTAAIERLERANGIFARSGSAGSTEANNSLAILGRAYGNAERWTEALPLFERALANERALSGENARSTTNKRYDRAFHLLRAGRTEQAIAELQHVLAVQESSPDTNPRSLRTTRVALADALCTSGPSARGFDLVRNAQEQVFPDLPAWTVAIAAGVRAACDPQAGTTTRNEGALQHAIEVLTRERGAHAPQTRDMVRRLARFHAASGARGKARVTLESLDHRFAMTDIEPRQFTTSEKPGIPARR